MEELNGELGRLQEEIKELDDVKDALDRDKAGLQAKLDAMTRTREQLEEESRSTFKLVAAELLNHSRKAINEEGKASLGVLLTPLKEQIDGLNKELKEYQHKQDVNSQLFGKELQKMVEANKEISQEATRLSNALVSNNKIQGDWGEGVLKRILDLSGLEEGINYQIQVTRDSGGNVITNDEGAMLRPDFALFMPDGKSLIIDKSKCYVLYDGYSKDLFKNVRSGRSTTYNNVQDAIDNVQTNESSITMSIPPYSKWSLPVEETNVAESKMPSTFFWDAGNHPLTAFSYGNPTIEFVIPYTFDYALAKWKTSRNKLFVGNIRVEKTLERLSSNLSYGQTIDIIGVSSNEFYRTQATSNDLMSYYQTMNYNSMIEEHNEKVENKKEFWSVGLLFVVTLGVAAAGAGLGLLIGALVP